MKLRIPHGKVHEAEQRYALYKELKQLSRAERVLQHFDAAQAVQDAVEATDDNRTLLALELAGDFIAHGASAAAIPEPEQVQVLEGLATLLSRRTPTPISKDVAHAALHALAQQQLGPSCFFAPGLLSQLCSTLQECAAWDAEREQAANPWGQPCVVEACLALAQLCRQVPEAMAQHASSWVPHVWHAALAQPVPGAEARQQPKQDDDFGIVRSAALAALEPVVHMLVDHPLGPGSPDTMSEVQAALEAQLVQDLESGSTLLQRLLRAIGAVSTAGNMESSGACSEAPSGPAPPSSPSKGSGEQLALDGVRLWGYLVDLLGASYLSVKGIVERLFNVIKPAHEAKHHEAVSVAAYDAWTCVVRNIARHRPEELRRHGLIMAPITYELSRTLCSSAVRQAALRCWTVLCGHLCAAPGSKPSIPLPGWAVRAVEGAAGIKPTSADVRRYGPISAATPFRRPSPGSAPAPVSLPAAGPNAAENAAGTAQQVSLRSPSPPALIPTPHLCSPAPSTGPIPLSPQGAAGAVSSGPSTRAWGSVPALNTPVWKQEIQIVLDLVFRTTKPVAGRQSTGKGDATLTVEVPLEAAAVAQVVRVLCRLTKPETVGHLLPYLSKVLAAWSTVGEAGAAAAAGAAKGEGARGPSTRLCAAMSDPAHCGAWVELLATLLAALLCKLCPDAAPAAATDAPAPPSTRKGSKGGARSGGVQQKAEAECLELLGTWQACQQQVLGALGRSMAALANEYAAAAAAAAQTDAACAAGAEQQHAVAPAASPLRGAHGKANAAAAGSGKSPSLQQLQEQAVAARRAKSDAWVRLHHVIVHALRMHSQLSALLASAAAAAVTSKSHPTSAGKAQDSVVRRRLLQLLAKYVHGPLLAGIAATRQLHEAVPAEAWQGVGNGTVNSPLSAGALSPSDAWPAQQPQQLTSLPLLPQQQPQQQQQPQVSTACASSSSATGARNLKPGITPPEATPFGSLCSSWARVQQLNPALHAAEEWDAGLVSLVSNADQGLGSVGALLHLLDCVGRAVGWLPPSYLEGLPRGLSANTGVNGRPMGAAGCSSDAAASKGQAPASLPSAAGVVPVRIGTPGLEPITVGAGTPGTMSLGATAAGGMAPCVISMPQFSRQEAAAVYLRAWKEAAAHVLKYVDGLVDATKYNDARQVLLCGYMEVLERLMHTMAVLASESQSQHISQPAAASRGAHQQEGAATIKHEQQPGLAVRATAAMGAPGSPGAGSEQSNGQADTGKGVFEAMGLWKLLYTQVSRFILDRWKARSNKPLKLVHCLAMALSSHQGCLQHHGMAQFCLCSMLELMASSPQIQEALSPKYGQKLAAAVASLAPAAADGQRACSPAPFSPLTASTPQGKGIRAMAAQFPGGATPGAALGNQLPSSNLLATPLGTGLTPSMQTPGKAVTGGTPGPRLPAPATAAGARPVGSSTGAAAGRPKGGSETVYEVSNSRRAVKALTALLRMLPPALMQTQQTLAPATAGHQVAGGQDSSEHQASEDQVTDAKQPVQSEAHDVFLKHAPASRLYLCLKATSAFFRYLPACPPTMATAQALGLFAQPLTQLMSVSLPTAFAAASCGGAKGTAGPSSTHTPSLPADAAARLLQQADTTWHDLLECLSKLLQQAAAVQGSRQAPPRASAAAATASVAQAEGTLQTGTQDEPGAALAACVMALVEPIGAALKCGVHEVVSPTLSAMESLVALNQQHRVVQGMDGIPVTASQGGGLLPELLMEAVSECAAAGFAAAGSLPYFSLEDVAPGAARAAAAAAADTAMAAANVPKLELLAPAVEQGRAPASSAAAPTTVSPPAQHPDAAVPALEKPTAAAHLGDQAEPTEPAGQQEGPQAAHPPAQVFDHMAIDNLQAAAGAAADAGTASRPEQLPAAGDVGGDAGTRTGMPPPPTSCSKAKGLGPTSTAAQPQAPQGKAAAAMSCAGPVEQQGIAGRAAGGAIDESTVPARGVPMPAASTAPPATPAPPTATAAAAKPVAGPSAAGSTAPSAAAAAAGGVTATVAPPVGHDAASMQPPPTRTSSASTPAAAAATMKPPAYKSPPLGRGPPVPTSGLQVKAQMSAAAAAALCTASAAAALTAAKATAPAASVVGATASATATATATAVAVPSERTHVKASASAVPAVSPRASSLAVTPGAASKQGGRQLRRSGRKRNSVGVHTYSRLDASQSQQQPWLGCHSSSSSSSGPLNESGLGSGAAVEDDAATPPVAAAAATATAVAPVPAVAAVAAAATPTAAAVASEPAAAAVAAGTDSAQTPSKRARRGSACRQGQEQLAAAEQQASDQKPSPSKRARTAGSRGTAAHSTVQARAQRSAEKVAAAHAQALSASALVAHPTVVAAHPASADVPVVNPSATATAAPPTSAPVSADLEAGTAGSHGATGTGAMANAAAEAAGASAKNAGVEVVDLTASPAVSDVEMEAVPANVQLPAAGMQPDAGAEAEAGAGASLRADVAAPAEPMGAPGAGVHAQQEVEGAGKQQVPTEGQVEVEGAKSDGEDNVLQCSPTQQPLRTGSREQRRDALLNALQPTQVAQAGRVTRSMRGGSGPSEPTAGGASGATASSAAALSPHSGSHPPSSHASPALGLWPCSGGAQNSPAPPFQPLPPQAPQQPQVAARAPSPRPITSTSPAVAQGPEMPAPNDPVMQQFKPPGPAASGERPSVLKRQVIAGPGAQRQVTPPAAKRARTGQDGPAGPNQAHASNAVPAAAMGVAGNDKQQEGKDGASAAGHVAAGHPAAVGAGAARATEAAPPAAGDIAVEASGGLSLQHLVQQLGLGSDPKSWSQLSKPDLYAAHAVLLRVIGDVMAAATDTSAAQQGDA